MLTDLFSDKKQEDLTSLPLAVRMRPRNLEEFIGQEHILGKDKLLRRAIEADRVTSLILYGPAGTGKTTLVNIIACCTKAEFERINAVSSGVEELKKAIERARLRKINMGRRTIVFIDEIHRFNKAQQDVLMPDLESGNFILVGATVQNPLYYLSTSLLSRSLIFELKPLGNKQIRLILERALSDQERGLGNRKVECEEKVLDFLSLAAQGDARRALNALEIGIETTAADKNNIIHFTLEAAQDSIQKNPVVYDRDGDEHYNTISAFIKSMRGSDPDASIYWLAKMLEAGEDARFVARRICICAAEDVGNADPMALILAQAAFSVADLVGMPEARIPLAQAAIYVASAPKSNACYLAIDKAIEEVRTRKAQEVPIHLKDSSHSRAKEMGKGKGYKYPHDYPGHTVNQDYMQEKIRFYFPSDEGYEKKIKQRRSFSL